jgi:hypothetical protein
MRRFFSSVCKLLAFFFGVVLLGATLNGVLDVARMSAPSNPSAGSLRLYGNNSTGKLACLDSTGADCMPGGGGGGAAPAIGTFSTVSGTACTAGQIGLTTDSVYLGVCNSTPAWRWLWGSILVSPAASSGWTWTNQGTSSVATVGGAQLLTLAGSPSQWRLYQRTAPATPYSATLRWVHDDLVNVSNTMVEGGGVCLTDGTKFEVLYAIVQTPGGAGYLVEKWNSTNSFSAGPAGVYSSDLVFPAPRLALPNFQSMRVADDGTNVSLQYATDGANWVTLWSEARTAFFAAGPTSYGFCWRSTTAQSSRVTIIDVTEQ